MNNTLRTQMGPRNYSALSMQEVIIMASFYLLPLKNVICRVLLWFRRGVDILHLW
jgi:hypothetical protein